MTGWEEGQIILLFRGMWESGGILEVVAVTASYKTDDKVGVGCFVKSGAGAAHSVDEES